MNVWAILYALVIVVAAIVIAPTPRRVKRWWRRG